MNYCLFQILSHTYAIVVLHYANCYSGRVLEGNVAKRLLYSHCPPLCLHVEYDLVGELRGSSLGQQTLRQVSIN